MFSSCLAVILFQSIPPSLLPPFFQRRFSPLHPPSSSPYLPFVIQSLLMADLYPPSYPPRQQQPQPYHSRDSQSYQLNQQQALSYPAIMSSHQSHQQPQQQQPQPPPGSLSPDDDHPQKQPDQPTTPKADQPGHSKPQATFLTKLYALVPSPSPFPFVFRPPHSHPNPLFCSLLERPENHHMIRWDPAGEYIIVEKPEQLALHVLPSVYRQSRFASFSRQLNVRPALSLVPSPTPVTPLFLFASSPDTRVSRSMVSCAKLICGTLTQLSTIQMPAPGVSVVTSRSLDRIFHF